MRDSTLELRLTRLEAKDNIRELVARYGLVIDDHDLPGIAGCSPQMRNSARVTA